MSAHMPGPWEIEEYDVAMGGKRYEVSAQIDGKWTRVTQPMESEANARLIASAPALLEALEAVMAWEDMMMSPEMAEQCRAAIAQAKGETK